MQARHGKRSSCARVLKSIAAAAAIGLGGLPQTAIADTWTATANGTWGTGSNWQSNAAPSSGSTTSLIFGGTSATYTATNDLGAFTFNSLSITNTGATTIASPTALTLGGASPTLNTNPAAGASVINAPLLITPASGIATITNAASSPLTLGGTINYSANASVVYTGGDITSGTTATTQTFGANSSVTYTGTGTLTLGPSVAGAAFAFGTGVTISNGTSSGTYTGNVALRDTGTGSNWTGSSVTINLANYSSGTFTIGNMSSVSGTLKILAGTVAFAGATGGDLFGNSITIDVAQGATFDFASNGETMGGVQGAGTFVLSAGITCNLSGNRTFTGKMTGSFGFTHDGTGVFTWGNAVPSLTSNYSGNTSITGGGSIVCTAANVLSPNSLMVIQPLMGTLDVGGFDQTVLGLLGGVPNVGMNIGASTFTINPASGTTRTYFGNITGTGNLTVGGAGTEIMLGAHTYSGTTTVGGTATLRTTGAGLAANTAISTSSGSTLDLYSTSDETWAKGVSGAGNFTKSGPAIVTIAAGGLMPNIGGIGVSSGGTLKLDYSGNNASKIGASTALLLGSGTVAVVGNSSAATAETFASTKLLGGGKLTVTTGNDQNSSLTLGALTRSAGGTFNVNLVNTGAGIASVTTTTPNTGTGAANIVGGYATVNGTDWAVTGTGGGPFTVTALGTYSTNDFGVGNGGSANAHSDVSGTQTPAATFTDVATLRFNTAGATSLTLAAGLNSLTNGGILVTPAVGANTVTISGGATVTGKLDVPAASELVLQQHNTAGQLTISSIINGVSTSVITKAGPGTVAITNIAATTPNTFGGTWNLVDGVLSIAGTIAMGPAATPAAGGPTTNFMGGTLKVTGAYSGGTTGTMPWVVTSLGGTLDVNSSVTATKNGNTITGTGPLTKIGLGTFSIGTNASTYGGFLTASQGVIRTTANVLTSIQGLSVESAAQYQINDNDAAGAFNFATTGLLILNGPGLATGSTPGAFALTDQGGGTANLGPITTYNTSVYLAATSNFGVYNGTAPRVSLVTFANPIGGPGGLTKVGPGTMVISAVNTYGGPTTVANGILRNSGANRIPAASALTLGDAVANTSGTFDLNAAAQTFSSIASAGTGTSNAVVNLSTSTTIPVLTINYAGGTPQINGAALGGGQLGGNHFTFTKSGSGTLTLNGATPMGGLTTVAAGTLALGSANALTGVGAVRSNFTTVAGVSVTSGATVDTNGQAAFVRPLTLNGAGVGGAGALVNNGSGVTTFNPDVYATTVSAIGSGYSAATTVSISGGGGSGATATPSLGLSAATFTMSNVGSGYGTTQPIIIISGGGGFGATATAVLSGGTITGFTIANPGFGYTSAPTITISAPSTGTTATATADATHFVVNGISVTNPGSGYTSAPTVSISGTGTGATAAGLLGGGISLASASTVGGSGDIVINSVVSGAGALSKVGANTLTLAGANTYGGGTTITAGTVWANTPGPASSTGTGAVTVNGGTLGGTGNIAGAVTVNPGGTLAPGNSVGTLSITSTLTLGNTGAGAAPTYAAEIASDGSSDLLAVTGALSLNNPDTLNLLPTGAITGPTTYTIASYGTETGVFDSVLINGQPTQNTNPGDPNYALVDYNPAGSPNTIQVTVANAVPEPAAIGVVGIGAIGLLARRRRRW
jgi:autotransporter-associated beta strand protein